MKKFISGIIIGTLISVMSIGVFATTQSYTLVKTENIITVDGERYNSDTLPILSLELNGGSNTYVPLRALSEMLSADINWVSTTNTIEITSNTSNDNGNSNTNQNSDNSTNNEVAPDNKLIDGEYKAETSFANYVITVKNEEIKKVIVTTKDGIIYNCEFANDNFNGNAEIIYRNKDAYKGNLLNGLKDGYGVYTWSNGEKYDGEWSNDMMNGTGAFYYASGTTGYKLEGTFVNNLPNGECLFYVDKNTSYSTTWQNGKCIKVTE